jgi:Mlc titration factor MtfA (ptsG expression regulator)
MIFGFLKRWRRRRARAGPFPAAWKAVIARNVPSFRRLPADDQAELCGHIQIFLAEKYFEGCGGLEITDEIRLTIAAQACLLLLHRTTDYYPQLVTILVYPSAYITHEDRYIGNNIWEQGPDGLLGHTASRMGSLVLAWDEAKRGGADPEDGRNLILHEFAHQLDFEDCETDGVPLLGGRSEYLSWGRIMSREFEQLRSAEEEKKPTILGTYGATNPAEFFAVVTETFFERPADLRANHPKLYGELARFFHQDPATYWQESKDAGGDEKGAGRVPLSGGVN